MANMQLVVSTIMTLILTLACKEIPIHPDLSMSDLRQGKGQGVSQYDTVYLRYVGTFNNGQVFDTSGDKVKKYSMRSPTLIDGWKVGLLGMKKGGKRRLSIPPEMAFGKKGKFGSIPPNATLNFEIELVKID